MTRILLPVLMVMLVGPSAQAAPKNYTCLAHDFAQTKITFVERGEALLFSIQSQDLDRWISGVKFVTESRSWRMQRLSFEIPLSKCLFHATNANIFQCNPEGIRALVEELPSFSEEPLADPKVTALNWASFQLMKVTQEFHDGTTFTNYQLNTNGYGEAGEFAMLGTSCALGDVEP